MTQHAVWELRWPAPARPRTDADGDVAIDPQLDAVRVQVGDDVRVALEVTVEPGASTCDVIALEVYGQDAAPLEDELRAFAGSLRPWWQLPAFDAARSSTQQAAVPWESRPAGSCADPVLVDGPVRDDVGFTAAAEEAAIEVAQRFLDDRSATAQAEDCLTASGLGAYIAPRTTGTCLFTCRSTWRLTAEPGTPVAVGASSVGDVDGVLVWAPVELVSDDGVRRRLDESYTVVYDGDGRARIGDARVEDAVPREIASRAVTEHLLEALSQAAWDAAYGYLVNEGISPEVAQRLGGHEVAFEDRGALERLCERALCGAAFELAETTLIGPAAARTTVRFASSDGDVVAPMLAGQFEGIATAGSLPPDGRVGDDRQPLYTRLFRGRGAPEIAVVRDGYVERASSTGSDWVRAPALRSVGNLEVIADRYVFQWQPGQVATLPVGGDLTSRRALTSGTLIDVADLDGSPVAVVEADDGHRKVVAVPDGRLVDADPPPAPVTVHGDTISVTTGQAGTTPWPAPGTVGHVEYDGRWIVARLHDATTESLWLDEVPLGRVMVVDTRMDESWTVDTYARIRLLDDSA